MIDARKLKKREAKVVDKTTRGGELVGKSGEPVFDEEEMQALLDALPF